MENIYLDWSDFKARVSNKARLRWTDRDAFYKIAYFDGGGAFETTIMKSDPAGSDQTDFETNYKPHGNKNCEPPKNEAGAPTVAPTFEDAGGLTVIWKGSLHVAAPNSLNVYDEVVTSELKLRNGWYRVISGTPTVGDYVEFSIIDKDNVLGLFAAFGLTVGVDILELKKFIRTEYVHPTDTSAQHFASDGASEVMAGLYFRVYYLNTGNSAVTFSTTRKYHEA